MKKFVPAQLPKMTGAELAQRMKGSVPPEVWKEADWDKLAEMQNTDEVWLNDLYQVNIRRNIAGDNGWPVYHHVSVKRIDKQPVHDWRHLQQIKSELIGPENEAIEIYPAESRLVDSANQYHLWVFADPNIRVPCGFGERFVQTGTGTADKSGAVQRPL